ncbi:unnamed protein product [Bemisia tabaci]|uniref:Uncharacterized protein n=1 Tax=Bemisia tabaci TaxID=7038 RepID=A0A9P0AH67_BEMTA|nr:unnamed protein product [Bemisia tabaci]
MGVGLLSDRDAPSRREVTGGCKLYLGTDTPNSLSAIGREIATNEPLSLFYDDKYHILGDPAYALYPNLNLELEDDLPTPVEMPPVAAPRANIKAGRKSSALRLIYPNAEDYSSFGKQNAPDIVRTPATPPVRKVETFHPAGTDLRRSLVLEGDELYLEVEDVGDATRFWIVIPRCADLRWTMEL